VSKSLRNTVAFIIIALVAGTGVRAAAQPPVTILNVSYDPTRELYQAINLAFTAYWKKKTGQDVVVNQSHGGSGAQARAVIEGLEADVVTLALAYDIDAISSKAQLLPSNWQSRLPSDSSPYTSTIDFVVRKGNPKHIRDWSDLVKPGIGIVTPNPKTSGGARWNFLAAYGYALDKNHSSAVAAQAFVGKLYGNAVVLDSGARGATTSFAERGLGDVLIAWENEAILLQREHPGQYEIVTPSESVLAEPTVSLVDANAKKHGTQAVSRAYLEFLYSPAAQKIEADNGFRPSLKTAYAKSTTRFARVKLFDINRFGGWQAAQKTFFSDGGVFDRIYHGS
jgi:sulfate transport system substrate-binding protein